METKKLQDIVIEACEIIDANYSLKDDVFEIEVTLDEDRIQQLSVYQSTDSFDHDKIICMNVVGPIIKNVELLYTFLKNNSELDYGSFAIINEDDTDLLVITDSTPMETCSGDELASIIWNLADVADQTEELLSKYK